MALLNLLVVFTKYSYNNKLYVYGRRILFALVFTLALVKSTEAQDQISALNIKVDKFPKVKGDLWVRNPDGIPSNITFIETGINNEVKPVLGSEPKVAEFPKDQKKAVVFLVLNPGIDAIEYNWYKTVIKNAIDSVIQKGDKVEVLTYDRECDGQLLYPLNPTFTDNVDSIKKKVDNLSKSYCGASSKICSQENFLTWQAINSTIDLLETQDLKLPTAIVVLGDDKNCTAETNGLESVGSRALRLNIPIYAIIKPRINGPFNSIEDACKLSHGVYYKETNLQKASERLKQFLSSMLTRNAGLLYSFEYTSAYKNDGNIQKVKIKTSGNGYSPTGEFQLSVPSQNFVEWMKDNPFWLILFILAFGGMLTGALLWRSSLEKKRKNDLERIESERRSIEEKQKAIAEEHQMKQNELNAQIERHQKEMDYLKLVQIENEQNKIRNLQEDAAKATNAGLVMLMKSKGNFPWFDYFIPGAQSVRFEINKPKIVIGRGEDVDLRVQVPTISKRHFVFWFTKQGEFWVKDENSSNGLFVNGVKVSQTKLKHGDFIQAGEVVFNFYI